MIQTGLVIPRNYSAMLSIAQSPDLSVPVKQFLVNWLKTAPEQTPSAIQEMTRTAIWKTGPYANLDQATAESYMAQAAAAAGRAKAAAAGSTAASQVGASQQAAQAQAEAESSAVSEQMVADIMAMNPNADISGQGSASGIDLKKVLIWSGVGVGAWWLLKKVL